MKEKEIRKRDVFNKYLDLVEKDIKTLFDFKSFIEINCPACDCNEYIQEFEKLGFKYVSCKSCLTLFVNPRPCFETLKEFYANSPSANFWINEFFYPMAEARREKIFKPRAEYISKICSENGRKVIGDIGAGFGIFLEELRKILPANEYVAIEPSAEMIEICRKKNLGIICSCLEDVDGADVFDIITVFELLEHLFAPYDFFKKIHSLLKGDGYLFLTTLNVKSFDILLLWNRSKNVTPPHHLNFFNPLSIKILLERVGFNILEISTPGKLDWDIIEGAIKDEGNSLGKFWDLVVKEGTEDCKKELQQWISKNNFSSHMRVCAKKY